MNAEEVLSTDDSGEADPLKDINVLMGLYGGPDSKPSWEPEPIHQMLTSVNKPPWEFSSLIYDVVFYILLAAILIGQLMLLAREARKVFDHLVKKFFLGRKLTEFTMEDWNQIHINKYTPFQVDYVKGNTEDYRLHIEDYRELLGLLNFVGEQSGT
ncbi:hypothetical protein EG68_03919 [Paragonimus skrjabini miyazakii]|uniref:Uncharacterized protein n=1 Tax=Paragonimus skrjabini miyazakii TaxID=59628 RepID=A0A8S9Y8L9_9TREM|nr:hypothetical protein EG68_03919 [Paragonimus skrjabini miyazakii]